MHTIFNELIDEWDEIASIEYVGEEETIDINTTGNRLFYANDILTHNSAVEEIEFDHSHIAGGISKINTADNVFGIFTSRSMRERGKYQIQCMKSRSSTGVGNKIDLEYNIDTMRITDENPDNYDTRSSQPAASANDIMNKLTSTPTVIDPETGEIMGYKKNMIVDVQGSKLKNLLNSLKKP
jgi:hypothetical protein